MQETEIPVLIVGGSLVGLSTALLLGHHGIRTLTVERHRGTAIHPRAAQVSQRTMEIFRTVGIEQIVRDKSGGQFVQDGAIMAVETLAGKELAWYISNLNEGVRDVSPCERVFITQSLLEPPLKARAEELGAEFRFGTEMISFEQNFEHTTEGVTAVIRDRESGLPSTVRAQYMIAADGAHSQIRERLGIKMQGRGVFSNSVTIYFRGQVGPLLRGRNLSVIYVLNPTLRGFFRFEKPFDTGFLAVNAVGDPAHPITDVSTGLTEQRCLELIHAALGTDEIPITIQSVMNWNATADVAERFRAGRIFLAGDAAHVMPPNGGFGGNTGVQDAHNLAWKLALVLKGIAGPELLATYESERRPVAAFTVEQAYTRYVTRTAPYLGTEGLQPAANDLNVELGYCYEGPGHENPRETNWRPGSRAPHIWMEDSQTSTLDLFGKNFVLLTSRDGNLWREAAEKSRVKIDLHTLDSIASGAILIRPDGFVAWRGDAPGDLQRALTRLIGTRVLR